MKKNKAVICILVFLLFASLLFFGYKFVSKTNQNKSNRNKFYSVDNLSNLGVLYNDYFEIHDEFQILSLDESDGVPEKGIYIVAKGNGLKNEIRVKVTDIEGQISKKYLISYCGPDSMGRCMYSKYQLLIINKEGELFSTIFKEGGNYPNELKIHDFLHHKFDVGYLKETQIKQLTDEINNIKFEKIESKYKIKDAYRLIDMCGYNCYYKSVKFGSKELEYESVFVETEEGILLKLNDYSLGKTIDYYIPYILEFDSKLAINSDYNLFIYNKNNYSVKQVTHNKNSLVVDSIVQVSNEEFYVFDVNKYVYKLDVDYYSPTSYKIKKLKKYRDYENLYENNKFKINYLDGTSEVISVKTESGELGVFKSNNNDYVIYYEYNNESEDNISYNITIDKNANIIVSRTITTMDGYNSISSIDEYVLKFSNTTKGLLLFDYVPKIFDKKKSVEISFEERKNNETINSFLNAVEYRDESYIK